MLTAVPDRSARLSGGILIEGSILARVMGVRLLTLDATIVLTPADVTSIQFQVPKAPSFDVWIDDVSFVK